MAALLVLTRALPWHSVLVCLIALIAFMSASNAVPTVFASSDIKDDTPPAPVLAPAATGYLRVQKKEYGTNRALTGWDIALYKAVGCTGSVLAQKKTDWTGKVLFTNLAPGTYYVKEDLRKAQIGGKSKPTYRPANNASPCQAVNVTANVVSKVDFANAPLYFVAGQLIVTGPNSQITSLASISPTLNLTLIRSLNLNYFKDLPAGTLPDFTTAQYQQLVMNQYSIKSADPQPVEDKVRALNVLARDRGLSVYVDPNYLIACPAEPVSSDPWSIGGSPFGGGIGTTTQAVFWQQWAFDTTHGIGLLKNGAYTRPWTGKGVQVAVFDTSPFAGSGTVTRQINVTWISPTLTLTDKHLDLSSYPGSKCTHDVRDHGLAVAGLIHAIAPQSSIKLVRVLNDSGQGDLATLNGELDVFVRQIIPLSKRRAVINLSLGVNVPQMAVPLDPRLNETSNVVAIKTWASAATGFRIVMVAAAGNDSGVNSVQATQRPGSYPAGIGVAASNQARGRSCFSNRGEIAAPGGDGHTADTGCAASVLTDCPKQPDLCVISLASQSPNYAYWAGTSFAAPLVTGLAAWILGSDHANNPPSPDSVQQTIKNTVTGVADPNLGAGIINVKKLQ